jgi:serine/threonine protein kinase
MEVNVNPKKCPQCGFVFGGAVVVSDLCPKCLLKQALKGRPAEDTETLWPPSVELLAKAMHGNGVEPIKLIGQGGMGAVYKAWQWNPNRIVALKVMPPTAADGGTINQRFHRFKREARLLKQLSHPNVVTVHDFELAGDFVYFTMDLVDGRTLREMLTESAGPLSPSYAFKLFLQLCNGLRYAHQSGVIHRDIKPENLLVDKEGVLKIVDFGIAKLNRGGASTECQTSDSWRMGTLNYMAPEQVGEPKAVDYRADIYSAGVVLYEMLTGERPLGLFPPPPSQTAKVDSSWDAVLFRALASDVARRYQDMREFKRAVVAALCWGGLGHGSKSFRDMPETYRRAA